MKDGFGDSLEDVTRGALVNCCPTNTELRRTAAGRGKRTGVKNKKLGSMAATMGRPGWGVLQERVLGDPVQP